MKNAFTLIFSFILSLALQAQQGAIKGKILDDDENGVAYATLLLKNYEDSILVKADASGMDGDFTFSQIPEGTYFIEVTYVGYSNYFTNEFYFDANSDYNVPLIRLSPEAALLSEIVVKSTRPIVEVQPDKTVFNVEGSVNAVGNTALELLRKSPGVVVDNNDNLMLQGKNGVQVYIDGKKSPLSSDDLANYLKTLQSTEIDAIEIITNPSAKYEAEGNAGIINIRLKKDKSLGANGSVNLGYRYGETGKYNGSANFNFRNKAFNTFGSYSLFKGDFVNDFFLYREQGGNIYDQSTFSIHNNESHGFKFGTDFFVSDKSTIGFLVNGNINNWDNNSESNTDIASISDRQIDSFLIAQNNIAGDRDNYNFNLNYAYNSGDGKTLNFDLDYGMFRNKGTSYQPNQYFAADGSTLLFERTYSNVTPTDIDIYTAKVDYESDLAGGKLAMGAKSSYVKTDNTFDNYDIIEGDRIKNLDRSNNFVYKENINALYSSWQKAFGEKLNLMLGLRMEHTNSKGDLTSNQVENDEVVERDYVNLFPSLGVTYQLNQDNSLRVNYSRRIDRPSYQDLNPFEWKIDELTFERGNPFLNPQYSNSYSLTHTYKSTLNSTLSYTVTKDVFTRITDAVDDKAATLTYVNLAKQSNLALTVSYPFAVVKWWNVYATATGYRIHNEANIEGKIIDLKANAFNFYGQNSFMLPKGFKLEVSGWYNSPGIWAGNWTTESQFDVSAGLAKSFWDDNATLKVSVSDIFRTNPWAGESQFGSLYIRGSGQWESRQLRVNFTYLLGNKQVKGARKRKTGLEDEQSRIKDGD